MVSKIKETIQDNLVKKRYHWYQEQIRKQTLTYDEWIREKEAQEDETLRAGRQAAHAQATADAAQQAADGQNVASAHAKTGVHALHAEVISYDECRADFDVQRYAKTDAQNGGEDARAAHVDAAHFTNGASTSNSGNADTSAAHAHGATPADVLIFHAPDASPDTRGISRVLSWFEAHPETVIAYADEDELDEAGKRKNPWLKPDWSPDTLMSCFYFGGFFAVRRQAMENCPWLGDENPLRNLYDLVLRLTEIENGTAHIDSVLFHHKKIEVWGMEETYDDLKKAAYLRRGWAMEPSGKVSIIIPTKDHPRILSNCIHSVLESGNYRDFEIIVVDNGSNEQNRARIERMRDMLNEDCRFVYHYEPMEFNFSRMCNIGASLANGDYILLLNDDIEITQDNWLEKLMEKAVLPHVGAVGAKLIYPGTEIIQHAGITNIHLGPAHKLQFRSDALEFYFGRNRMALDVIGVTGACLLVKKSIYDQAGGLSEQLRVAFNDVEFCYHLHEMGYYNVVRNDVTLTHHESLSRGADDSTEKLRRLHQELNLLYELHPSVYGTDPFYHRYLVKDVLDAEFYTGCRYDFDKRVEKVSPEKITDVLEPQWHNEVLRIGVEFAGDLGRWEKGAAGMGSGDWMIQGWTWALQVDNCRYDFSLLLKKVPDSYIAPGSSTEAAPEDREEVWKLPCTRQFRPDIDENLHGIINTELPGVCVTFDRDSLPEGNYLIGFLWEDTCSRQKLYRFSPEMLTVRK